MKIIRYNNNRGRFGNQLYYCLRAFIDGSKYYLPSENCLNSALIRVGMEPLICNTCSVPIKIQGWFQSFGKDFSVESLNEFVNKYILNSIQFKNFKLIPDECVMHIRNGDYINLKLFDVFDRYKYIDEACSRFRDMYPEVRVLRLVSDGIQLSMKLYRKQLLKYFDKIYYVVNKTYVDDFTSLSCYKYKILWNSTFSWWSAFISNVLYPNSEKCVFVPCNDNYFSTSKLRVNQKWNIIDV